MAAAMAGVSGIIRAIRSVFGRNFSGEGVPELTGADRATPLLFELFHALDYNSAGTWFKPGRGTDFRLVCKESGQVPSEHCARDGH